MWQDWLHHHSASTLVDLAFQKLPIPWEHCNSPCKRSAWFSTPKSTNLNRILLDDLSSPCMEQQLQIHPTSCFPCIRVSFHCMRLQSLCLLGLWESRNHLRTVQSEQDEVCHLKTVRKVNKTRTITRILIVNNGLCQVSIRIKKRKLEITVFVCPKDLICVSKNMFLQSKVLQSFQVLHTQSRSVI